MRSWTTREEPAPLADILSKMEFDCRPEMIELDDWVEVGCVHDNKLWHCGHHHRRIGPWLRCVARHVHKQEEKT